MICVVCGGEFKRRGRYRLTCNSQCSIQNRKNKQRILFARWRAKNGRDKEYDREYQKQYRKRFPEKIRIYERAYRAKNYERRMAQNKKAQEKRRALVEMAKQIINQTGVSI